MYKLVVSTRPIEEDHITDELVSVKVEFQTYGVATVRTIFALSNSDSYVASTWLSPTMLPGIDDWLKAGFEMQIVRGGSMVLDALRQMGWAFVQPDEVEDVGKYKTDKDRELQAMLDHLTDEQSGATVEDTKLSAFSGWFSEVDYDKELPYDELPNDE